MKAYVEVTGENDDVPCSIYSFFDNERFLFECGEGTQRFVHGRNGIVLSKVKTIFLTSLSWESIGGLIGFMLTHVEPHGQTLNLVGPKGLNHLLQASKDFQGIQNIKIIEIDGETQESMVINESSSIITAIPIKNQQQQPSQSKDLLVCYIGSTIDIKGKFYPDRATKLGVPKGKDFSKLANGESVISATTGDTITPSQVMDPTIAGSKFLIIRCPSKEYFQGLFENPIFKEYKNNSLKFSSIFHIVPREILESKEYIEFIQSITPSIKEGICRNVIINNQQCEYYPSFAGSDKQVSQLQTLVPNLFDCSKEERKVTALNLQVFPEEIRDSIVPCTKITRVHLAPVNIQGKLEIITIDANEDQGDLEFLTTEKGKLIKKELDDNIQRIESTRDILTGVGEYPKVLFTGTSSAIPSKFRNVTGNYIGLKDNRGILLDAGEGTFGQLFRFYGPSGIKDILLGIEMIWVSHMHADHHLGIPRLLQKQKEYSMKHSVIRPSTIVIGPPPLIKWLKMLSEITELEFIGIEYESQDDSLEILYETAFRRLHIKSMVYVPVEHCAGAYGLVIDWIDGFRLTYSGDTRPCMELAIQGSNSDLLIHEATFEDDKLSDAKAKRHSTTGEALQIGKEMNAKFIYLTHFSSRYPKLPATSNTELTNFGLAFDLLHISPYQYPFVQSSLKPIDIFFTHELEKKEAEKQKIADEQQQKKTDKLLDKPFSVKNNSNNNSKSTTPDTTVSAQDLELQQIQKENERLEKYYKKHKHVKKIFEVIKIDMEMKKLEFFKTQSSLSNCDSNNNDEDIEIHSH